MRRNVFNITGIFYWKSSIFCAQWIIQSEVRPWDILIRAWWILKWFFFYKKSSVYLLELLNTESSLMDVGKAGSDFAATIMVLVGRASAILMEIRTSRCTMYVLLLSEVLIDRRHFLDGVIDHLSRVRTFQVKFSCLAFFSYCAPN